MSKKVADNLALTDGGKQTSTYATPEAPVYQAQYYTGYTPYAATQYGGYADFYYDPYDQKKYDSEYKASIDNALNTLQNRVDTGFSYNALEDPLYKQYETSYTRNGRNAMEDTLARQSSKTGGVASSYAVSASNQAYQNYMAALADKVPELRQLAYNEWSDANSNYANLASLYGNQDDRAYGQWKDYEDQRYNIYQDQKNDAYNNYVFKRDADYANWEAREAANKLSWQAQQEAALTNYNAGVDAYNANYNNALSAYNSALEAAANQMNNDRYVNAYVGSGNVPTRSEILSNASSTYQATKDAQTAAAKSRSQQQNYNEARKTLLDYINIAKETGDPEMRDKFIETIANTYVDFQNDTGDISVAGYRQLLNMINESVKK